MNEGTSGSMWLALIFKALFLLTVIVGALAPALARQSQGNAAGSGMADADNAGCRMGEPTEETWLALRPQLADFARRLGIGRRVPPGVVRVAYRVAPHLAVAAPMAAFAVIPFGGRYLLGETQVALVVADLDWGVLWLACSSCLWIFAVMLAGWSSRRTAALEDAVRVGARWLAYALPTLLALVGLAMIFGSLRLTDIVAGQDRTVAVVGALGIESLLPGLTWLSLPAWGIFMQPIGFTLFLPGALMIARPRKSVEESDNVSGAGILGTPDYRSAYAGYRLMLFDLADRIALLAVSSVTVCLFLGGGALPYVDQAFIVDQVAEFYGAGLGTLVCMAVQVGAFFIKVLVIARLLAFCATRLSLPDDERMTEFCWKFLLPVSVLNSFATALLLLAGDGSA
jgi:NADH-quinone oxidoreductase subunit H